MDSIPIDIVLEISSRLPSKSIARCRFVSKLWASIFCRPDFTESFLTMSSARPRLLFAIRGFQNGELRFCSSPQPNNPYEKASLVVAADSHYLKCPEDMWQEFCGYVSGLICCCRHTLVSKQYVDTMQHVICNPSTGQYASLPKLRTDRKSRSYLGFDPIDKQFKVLCEADDDRRILTLGTGEMSWRKIQCPLTHYTSSEKGICINGVLYYLAKLNGKPLIVCFDVRSEKYRFIEPKCIYAKLINYKGKLCGINCNFAYGGRWRTIELHMWILEDAEKQESSKYVYTLQDDRFGDRHALSVSGVTATGEIVLWMRRKPYYVFYFNPERNTLQSVEIQGFGGMFSARNNVVYAFVDHVEDLNFNIL